MPLGWAIRLSAQGDTQPSQGIQRVPKACPEKTQILVPPLSLERSILWTEPNRTQVAGPPRAVCAKESDRRILTCSQFFRGSTLVPPRLLKLKVGAWLHEDAGHRLRPTI